MMVYVFGIDIPLIELMLVTIAALIVMFFFNFVFMMRLAKKEKDILESTRDLLESERKTRRILPKEVKKEGFFAKLFAAPEKSKRVSQESLTKKRNRAIFKKPTKSIFTQWNEFWNDRKIEAEKAWQQRYNVEVKKSLQTPVEIIPKQPKQESWWEKHKKEVEAKAREQESMDTEAEKTKTESWSKIHKQEIAKQVAEEKRDALLEERERIKKEKEWAAARRNSWWERHKREVAKRPDPAEQFDKFWKQRKLEAEHSWKPKQIEEPPKPHEIDNWWQKHMRRAAEEKAKKQKERELQEKQRAEERKREAEQRKAKTESWWEQHKKEVAVKQRAEKPQENMFSKWNNYWDAQKKVARTWRKK